MIDLAGKLLMLARTKTQRERRPVCTSHRVSACRLFPIWNFSWRDWTVSALQPRLAVQSPGWA